MVVVRYNTRANLFRIIHQRKKKKKKRKANYFECFVLSYRCVITYVMLHGHFFLSSWRRTLVRRSVARRNITIDLYHLNRYAGSKRRNQSTPHQFISYILSTFTDTHHRIIMASELFLFHCFCLHTIVRWTTGANIVNIRMLLAHLLGC